VGAGGEFVTQATAAARPWETDPVRSATIPLAVGAAAVAGLTWSVVEAQAYVLRRFTLPVLPAHAPTLRVLHVSDLHLVPRQRRKVDWLRRLSALDPDLVVSTGDTLAAMDAVPAALAAHAGLLERPGVFVLGSNDYFAPRLKNPAGYLFPDPSGPRVQSHRLPTAALVRGFREAGWLDLNNARAKLCVRGICLELRGVDDPHLEYDRYAQVAGPGDPGAELLIGVTHAPYRRVLDAMAADGAGLLIAGHTHGGQLCIPGIGALVTNCDLPRKQAKGVSRWPSGSADGAWMHVSAGLGTSPYSPVRFACRPEATLLTLTAR
jgi:predicted MPP superfamily phosphohydrolase